MAERYAWSWPAESNVVTDVAASLPGGLDIAAIRPGLGRARPSRGASSGRQFWTAAVALSVSLHAAAFVALLIWPSPPPLLAPPEAIPVDIVVEEPANDAPPPSKLELPPAEASPAKELPPPSPEQPPPPTVSPASPVEPSPAPQEAAQAAAPPTEPPPVPQEAAQAAAPALSPPPAPIAPPMVAEILPSRAAPSIPPPSTEPPLAPVEPPAVAETAPPPAGPAPLPIADIPPVAELTAPPITPVAPSTAKPPLPSVVAPSLAPPAQSPPQTAKPRGEPLRKTPVRAPPQSGPSESKPTNLALVTPRATLPAASSPDLGEYQRALFARISAVKRYPDAARERAAQGVAVVSFSISASGQVAGVSISRSAGDAILDAEALATVRRASPFPPPPAGAPRTFSAPLSFRVR